MGLVPSSQALTFPHYESRELGKLWSSTVDNAAESSSKFRRLGPAVLAFLASLACFVIVYTDNADILLHQLGARRERVRWGRQTLGNLHVRVGVGHLTSMNGSQHGKYSSTVIGKNPMPRQHIPQFEDIRMSVQPISHNSSVRKAYAKLTESYLRPFSKEGKIKRNSYLVPFLSERGICGGCFMVQVKDRKVYVYDPRGVSSEMAQFRELRMREAVHWIRSAVSRGVIDNTELVISTTDGVATTSRNHSYRMPKPESARPIFSVIQCNVSDNIPFPMILTDVLRRGLPHKFWKRQSGTLAEWDTAVEDVGRVSEKDHRWENRTAKAVFRGRIRESSYTKNGTFNSMCDRVGRTALWAKAHPHAEDTGHGERKTSKRNRMSPLPARLFLIEEEMENDDLLDVMVEGKCGKRIYVTDGMSIKEQEKFRYSIHTEGNSFWADRLLLLLFGRNAILKQECPCGMFFEKLMKEYVHYVPVDYFFEDISDKVRWMKKNDKKVVEMVRQMRKFGADFLSTAGVETYVDEVLKRYSDLLEDRKIRVTRGAVQVYP